MNSHIRLPKTFFLQSVASFFFEADESFLPYIKRAALISPFLASLLLSAPPARAGVPNSFTYQGSLKQNGQPVNGVHSIELRLTNTDGSQIYWTSGPQTVEVKEGLYKMEIAPTGVAWASVTPYIETKVNGVLYLPREMVTSTLYANLAKDVVDGAVTTSKITNGAVTAQKLDAASLNTAGYTVPKGAVLLFLSSACPVGYLEATTFRNRFVIGADIAKANASVPDIPGAAINNTLQHKHTITNTISYGPEIQAFSSFGYVPFPGNVAVAATAVLGSGVSGVGAKGKTFSVTSNESQVTPMPPGYTVLFCQKQ